MSKDWRSASEYTSSLASTGFLIEESRTLMETYALSGDPQVTCRALVDGALHQHMRATRESIMRVLRQRFLRWNPPDWVLTDLLAFARTSGLEAFRLSIFLHLARQDRLLYDFMQSVVVPRFRSGDWYLLRSHVQGFLDGAEENHPQIKRWTHATREKLSNNVLAVLSEGKMLQEGRGREKRIVAPLVPGAVAFHLIRLLEAEGIAQTQMTHHPDWNLWLCDVEQIQGDIGRFFSQPVMPPRVGSCFDLGYEPTEGAQVWIMVRPSEDCLEDIPMRGVIVRRSNIDERGLGNTYFDVRLCDGSSRTFHLPINVIFDHEPQYTRFEDRLGPFHKWA